MNNRVRLWVGLVAALILALTMGGCGPGDASAPTEAVNESQGESPALEAEATPTPEPTPTPTKGAVQAVNPCQGLSGVLEMQLLVGPAEAAGMEPVAVGEIPFNAVGDQPPYPIQGSGHISYDQTLVKEWGTYQVTMDMDATLSGECEVGPEGGALHTLIDMNGEQLLKVDAGEFQGEYPWSGEQNFDLNFPLEESATAMGEGWAFVLHLQ
jgi:hypothetical protein